MSYEILDKAIVDGIEWALVKTGTTKHFKNGKPNLHVEVTYSVERTDRCFDSNFNPIPEMRQRFWMSSKAQATKYFKTLTSQAVIVEREGAHALRRIFG